VRPLASHILLIYLLSFPPNSQENQPHLSSLTCIIKVKSFKLICIMPSSLIRLAPHPFSSLPPHPSLNDSPSPSRPSLETFLHSALTEAQNLITTTIPQTFKTDKKLRSSSPSTAKVQLSTGVVDNEYWVCRRSVHVDAEEKGTASWAEFEKGLGENHSENEMAYTPSVTRVEHLLEWPMQTELEGGWRSVHMHGQSEVIIIHIIWSLGTFFYKP
jgi:hypothetical protein